MMARATQPALRLGLVLGLISGLAGCATTLDQARVAWSDGAGDFDEAERLYLQASEDPSVGDIAREELVEIYLGVGKEQTRKNPQGAQRYFAKALELAPESAAARTGLIRTHRDLGELDQGIEVASDPRAKACGECRRLEAILLVRRGDAAMAAGDFAAAERDYGRAHEILPDSAVALAVVRVRLANKNLREAATALHSAANLLDVEDLTGRTQYLELRRAAVMLAIEQDDLELADQIAEWAPPGVEAQVQLEIAMDLALELRKKGKPDLALERMEALIEAADEGRMRLSDAQATAVRDRVAELYGGRAAVHLTSGRVDAAKADLDRALAMRPNDTSFKLQQVLVQAGRGKLDDARAALAKLQGAKGHQQIAAILTALEVDRLLEQGKTKPAADALERAKSLGADLPEVHVATAQMLVHTAPDLRRADLVELQRKGLISYPGGRVTRVAEALSELDWARQQIRGLGPAYAYRGPGTKERIDALEKQIRAFYSYDVRFHGDPTTVLVLRNGGSAPLRVSLRAGSFATDASLEPGGSKEVTIANPGLVSVAHGGTDAVFLAEPYTQVDLTL
jgi:tetratricopeptide (TPR) repeat protein